MVDAMKSSDKTVRIALVGKYTQLHDSYLSVVEALKHGGIASVPALAEVEAYAAPAGNEK